MVHNLVPEQGRGVDGARSEAPLKVKEGAFWVGVLYPPPG